MVTIYKIINPIGQLYIGQTKNIRKRKNFHKRKSVNIGNERETILYASIRKYGWENHRFEIIEVVDDNLGYEREIYWIKELKTYHFENANGLNMTIGGLGRKGTWMWNIELRKWYSERYKGDGSPFYGHKHTEENKKIIGEKAAKRNKERGITIPKWGAEKGRLNVIKAVLCYDKKGRFIAEFESIIEAATKLYVNRASITESCKGIITGVEGKYIFRFKEPNYPLQIEVGEIKKKGEKRIVLYIDGKGEIIKEYPSAMEASIELEIPKGTINRASLRAEIYPIRTGHIFVYKDLYNKAYREFEKNGFIFKQKKVRGKNKRKQNLQQNCP